MLPARITDARDFLPHFTSKLSLDLAMRLAARLREDGIPNLNGAIETRAVREWRYKLACEVVNRIHRTQVKEARATQSFAEELLQFCGVPDTVTPKPVTRLLERSEKALRSTFRAGGNTE